jgi:hypothetical protein
MTRICSAALALAATIICTTASINARADREHPLAWLREQPLTLFEWGTVRLERDLMNAGSWMAERDYSNTKPETGVFYSWRTKRITAYISMHRPPAQRTRAACRAMFRLVADRMMRKAPSGPGQASWYLQSVFVPQGRWWSRPNRSFGKDLTKAVILEIVLRKHVREAFNKSVPQVSCFGTFDAEDTEIQDKVTH